jgi:hypothetical protein
MGTNGESSEVRSVFSALILFKARNCVTFSPRFTIPVGYMGTCVDPTLPSTPAVSRTSSTSAIRVHCMTEIRGTRS